MRGAPFAAELASRFTLPKSYSPEEDESIPCLIQKEIVSSPITMFGVPTTRLSFITQSGYCAARNTGE